MLLVARVITRTLIEVRSQPFGVKRGRAKLLTYLLLAEMADNAGLLFQTPEEYFLDKPVSTAWSYRGFDPKTYDHSRASAPLKRLSHVLTLFRPSSTSILSHPLTSGTDTILRVRPSATARSCPLRWTSRSGQNEHLPTFLRTSRIRTCCESLDLSSSHCTSSHLYVAEPRHAQVSRQVSQSRRSSSCFHSISFRRRRQHFPCMLNSRRVPRSDSSSFTKDASSSSLLRDTARSLHAQCAVPQCAQEG